uniref:Uncharacterized protein n=1 Tax=Manihot esculenta TaxID=3983 RepID=A0A2C9VKT8_MANES
MKHALNLVGSDRSSRRERGRTSRQVVKMPNKIQNSCFLCFGNQKKPIISRFAGITISIAVVWTFDEILTVSGVYDNTSPQTQANCRTDRSGLISAAPWIRIPNPFQWGHPTFEVRDVCLVMVASLVATVESIGTFSASSRLGGEIRPRLPKSSRSRQPKSEPDIAAKEKRKNLFIRYVKAKENRSALHISPDTLPPAIGFQGVGTLIDAVFGMGFGCTASVEQTGLTGLTKVGSLRVVFVSAIFMLLLSTTGKVSAILASVPLPIAASLYIILSPYLLSSGLKDLHYLDLDRSKLNFILGFSLFVGISTSKYYSSDIFFNQGLPHSRSSWFKDIIQVIFSSAPTTATIVAFIFNLIMPIKSSKKEPKKKELKPKEEEMELRPLWEDWKIYIASRRSWKSTLGIPSHPSH